VHQNRLGLVTRIVTHGDAMGARIGRHLAQERIASLPGSFLKCNPIPASQSWNIHPLNCASQSQLLCQISYILRIGICFPGSKAVVKMSSLKLKAVLAA
jgi:hypothetical protein